MLLHSLQRWPNRLRRFVSRPWCTWVLRCAAAALTGAALSGAAVMELPVPMAPAYLCALTFGPEAVAAYLGAAAGYFVFWETADALEPLAAGFLILSGLGLFRDLLPEEARWFRSAAGSALYALIGLVFLLQGPMQPFEIVFFLVKLAVLAAFTAAFSGPRRSGALTLAWIAGCCKLLLPGGLPLGSILAAAAVCRALDGTNYLLTAAACGLVLDVCWEPLSSATFVFAASALAAHAAPLRTRAGKKLFFVCICAVSVLVIGAPEPVLVLAALAGGVLACFLPREDAAEPPERQGSAGAASAVLEELAQTLSRPAQPGTPGEGAAQRQQEARLAEARAIAADQYRVLARVLRSAPEEAAQPVYAPELGTRTRGRVRGADGDRVTSFRHGEWFYLLLCDGMGTGPEAARESETASSLLRRMIESGFDAQDALQTLNALYILRGDGGFSTVDLAQVSLVTGEGFLHKWGAAPSYLRSRLGIEKIGTASPPPGLGVGEAHRAGCVRLSLKRGETLVLVSDGIVEQAALRVLRTGVAPEALAAGIVSRGASEEPDDRSAAVLRLCPVPSRHKHSTSAAQILSNLVRELKI